MIYLSYPFYTEHIVDWKKETIVAYICYIIILKEDRNLFFTTGVYEMYIFDMLFLFSEQHFGM